MAEIQPGRWSAEVPDGTVVFLIGMRVNRLRAVRSWLPVARAMRGMLAELRQEPDLGLLHVQDWFAGRTTLSVQYWRDWEALHAYSRAEGGLHLPAWRAFNRLARATDSVGVYHETYVTGAGANEAVYVDMPLMGVARATASVEVASRGDSAAHRLDPTRPDVLTVP